MGIRGLSTFFNNNPDLSKPHKLFDTPVIIDGNNLIHLLYFRNKVDCVYGGDYNKYAAAIKKYFYSFLECNIRPIIVFDGGYDKSNRKYRTILSRSKTRLTLTQHIAKYGDCAGNVLPINAQEVFRCVLSEMGIPYAQCDFEADDQITALANYYNCPVLSDDSDFYIFDICKGFVRLSSVEATVVETTSDGVQCKYLNCDIYHIDTFLSYFPGIDKNILPLFGTLVGNDFVNTRDFANFFSNIQFPKLKCKGLKVKQSQRKIIGLLTWLKNFSLNEGINQVLSCLKTEKRDHVKYVIDQSLEGYRTQKCNLTFVIDGDLKGFVEILQVDTKLSTQCGEALPIPFVLSFHEGNLPSLFLNVINLHRTFLPAQVENIALESSYMCSRYIRQVIYGLLLQHSSVDSKSHSEYCLSHIIEFDRRNGSLTRETVIPVFNFKNGSALPNLGDVYSMETKRKQIIISDVLGTEIPFILSAPQNLQLLFACVNYWLKNCFLKPREEFLYAVIINLIYFNYISKQPQLGKSENNIKPHCGSGELYTTIAAITEGDAELAAQRMKKYLQKPILNMGNPLILHIVHSYSELQTCILYSVYLNMLFGCPFEHPKLHESFAGTLLYNLTKELMSRTFPDLFVAELLGRQSALSELFTLMKTKVLENVAPECLMRIDRSQLTKGKKNKKRKNHPKQIEVLTEDDGVPSVHQGTSENDLCMAEFENMFI